MGAPEIATAVLDVRNLSVAFATHTGPVAAVHDVSFTVAPGETLALVGESGSGKSVTSLAVMRLTPPAPRTRLDGQALFRSRDGTVRDLLAVPERAMRALRGNEIAMIFQEPMTSLNPVQRVGDQIAEAVMTHRPVGRREALDRAEHLLARVGISDARRRLAAFPHHLSGGMRQRVMIAMALACDPALLIADEPTTALDVTVQAQILELLQDLQRETGMAIVFITHNLGVVAEIADRVMVMYAGRIVEQGEVGPVMRAPLMPYTQGLLRAVPTLTVSDGFVPLTSIPGTVPSPTALPPGCAFEPRCPYALPGLCDATTPPLDDAFDGQQVRCLRWDAVAALEARP
ncbi:ABC transporter ATP-binding protein [Lichenifustis flavocetrariae]|uniref:ABC transporter ATP-binding protein n=1 Tax=Lichenifustis flavocetrariae TaxID=2949735 RepID=A0AA41YW13_9HYPH|nr:ABC transporter ATP-binding protein [Lichenifustis flavocetrariae]MCW6508261.1 ABC transporter ATP-binding protein [Lichenifustis flavocetrariae]